MNRRLESGLVNPWLIVSIITIITTVALGAGFGWAMVNYLDRRDNVDTIVAEAEAVARKDQADKDAAEFEIIENAADRKFAGPEDYGQLEFMYPKTWSVYVANDASTGRAFEAYLNPVTVPQVSNATQYALRVKIETDSYDDVISSYQTQVRRGDLTSSVIKVNGGDGTRLDGLLTKDIRGSIVIFRIRDKVVTLRTDADTFRGYFDAIVASTTFNK